MEIVVFRRILSLTSFCTYRVATADFPMYSYFCLFYFSWEEAKHLLMKDNFFQDLLFYDKDGISDALFAKIEKFCTSSGSDPEKLIPVSKAASSISVWVRAIYDYCCCMRKIRPSQLKLTDSEMELTKVSAYMPFGRDLLLCNYWCTD